MEINDRTIAITGNASITEDLLNDTEYLLTAEITTYSVGDQRSNNNGTVDVRNKAKISGVVVLQKGETVIHGHAKTSKASQKLRFDIEALADAEGKEREAFYQWYIGKIIENPDVVYQLLKTL